MTAPVAGIVADVRQGVGRYFSMISVLPSALLVIYLWLLIGSGAWHGSPNWTSAARGISSLGIRGAALVAILGITLGLVLHPLQFTMVQLLEGYWGTGQIAQEVRARSIRRHRRRLQALNELVDEAGELAESSPEHSLSRDRLRSLAHEAQRARQAYPAYLEEVMPTRLGNMLRRYEVGVGRPYGANLPEITPMLAVVAPPAHMAYVNDQRATMDLTVRICLVSLIACVATVVFLWDDGTWLLLALVPYGVVYLSYRGAVITASHYGSALVTLMALNRFTLYERLRLKAPEDSAEEAELHIGIGLMVSDFERPDPPLRYKHPEDQCQSTMPPGEGATES
ncbi:hypothetical protein O7627_27275 [Solwaraspora sp. WMMD1047]|uniref:hypothetical protein n=1 Tax=Solwaraspora sp. WMMD1047 TaxID=3016102 RepID=UPI002417B640|nr:hypothetical protein [Solwaraspora sp. WMMD1047]MDG4832979.1 hypothetical protein [Solwaraspora sp. WMMD1047]